MKRVGIGQRISIRPIQSGFSKVRRMDASRWSVLQTTYRWTGSPAQARIPRYHSLHPVHLGIMTRSTLIRSSLMYGLCALLNMALLGCSARMLTVNIINHGPPLNSVTIHYPLFGSRTLQAGLLPTGGEVSRTIYFRQNGNVWWSYRTSDGRDMMAGANLYLTEYDSGLILNIVDSGGAVRTSTSGLKRSSPSQEQNHPPPPRKVPPHGK
jgi:hypothetical protein